jgi:hypothetical protein
VRLSETSISSPATRVSLNQVIDCCSYAAERSHDPHFAYHTGLRFHVSAYGMYGFAILSSINYRQAMKFAVKYHQLATPLVTLEFKENDGYGIWLLNPLSYARIDARLYKFIVEMQFGIVLSIHRDFMGSSFFVREFQVTYSPSSDASKYATLFGVPVLFGQSTLPPSARRLATANLATDTSLTSRDGASCNVRYDMHGKCRSLERRER